MKNAIFTDIFTPTMKKLLYIGFLSVIGILGSCNKNSDSSDSVTPTWLETDSAAAIEARIKADFTLTRPEFLARVQASYPEVSDADLDVFLLNHYVEAMEIDGEQRFHRKSVRNLNLLNPDFNGGARYRGDHASPARISYVDSILDYYDGKNDIGGAHEVTYRFSIDVPYHKALAGDTLRIWMPVALPAPEGGRQRDLLILDATPSDYILSAGRSEHNSIYFTTPAPVEGDTAHFSYTARFITSGAYVPEDKILSDMQPYNTDSELYKRYTSLPDGPHIIDLSDLAKEIVGDETNPYRQSELVYDYIIRRYPWAGAREYSTIPCMPQYVVDEKHGDCGQVSLLYISLMRSLGVPARWESGWMLHPGEVNMHDWAEVYYQGIGWVPVDVSFGRYTTSDDPRVTGFYSHGIDSHRLAANTAVGAQFYPPKRYVRSETVDFQTGEVESTRGNLYYPGWDYHVEVLDVKPVEK